MGLAAIVAGSSPLTRGKRAPPRIHDGRQRLIPTHAGKTGADGCDELSYGAHPHSRGENEETLRPRTFAGGSSPLTRGKRGLLAGRGAVGGLIPTHAGKTRRVPDPHGLGGAHPHSRGENRSAPRSVPSRPGSSPLTRGKQELPKLQAPQSGLIPTHAGKTPGSNWTPRPPPAHPHSRGENGAGRSVGMMGHRLIPTHAGKT